MCTGYMQILSHFIQQRTWPPSGLDPWGSWKPPPLSTERQLDPSDSLLCVTLVTLKKGIFKENYIQNV